VLGLNGLFAAIAVGLMVVICALFAGLLVSAATIRFGLLGKGVQAEGRATVLLKEWLSPRQLFQYRTVGWTKTMRSVRPRASLDCSLCSFVSNPCDAFPE
jgi:hypothetical protein